MRLRSALLTAGLIVACLSAALVGPSAPRASADGPHRAVVVADSGTGVLVRGIEFGGDSISGLEALQLAGLAPVVQGFQGEGGAVCAVAGVGCPSDGSCLTCDARGYYWAYYRAPAGSGGFAYSRTGAGATRVHDGDVEGWKWGTGAAPPFHSFESVFPPTPPSTTPPPPVPSPGLGGSDDGGATGGSQTSGGTASPSATSGASSGGGGEAAAAPSATTTTTATGTTTPSSSPTTADAAAGERTTTAASGTADEVAFQAAQSGRPDQPSSRRGPVASVVLFAVTLAAVGALIVRNRRRRRARGLPDPAS